MASSTSLSARAPAAVLVEVFLPRATLAQNALLVITGSLFVALCAQISVPLPFSPVPVTGQTFAVLLLGAVLGARRSAAALVLYLAEGAAGLPVFAPFGPLGLARLAGPTGGYLLALPAAAFVLGLLVEAFAGRRAWWRWLGAVLAAEAVIFAAGVGWLKLTTEMTWAGALGLGLVPFLPGELFKAALVAASLPASWWALERRR
ncbi:MAG: biotin transporter BioY [Candidatus Acidiferrales bacterium]